MNKTILILLGVIMPVSLFVFAFNVEMHCLFLLLFFAWTYIVGFVDGVIGMRQKIREVAKASGIKFEDD